MDSSMYNFYLDKIKDAPLDKSDQLRYVKIIAKAHKIASEMDRLEQRLELIQNKIKRVDPENRHLDITLSDWMA